MRRSARGGERVNSRWGEKEQSGGGDQWRQGETDPENAQRGEASGGNYVCRTLCITLRLCLTHLHADHKP